MLPHIPFGHIGSPFFPRLISPDLRPYRLIAGERTPAGGEFPLT